MRPHACINLLRMSIEALSRIYKQTDLPIIQHNIELAYQYLEILNGDSAESVLQGMEEQLRLFHETRRPTAPPTGGVIGSSPQSRWREALSSVLERQSFGLRRDFEI